MTSQLSKDLTGMLHGLNMIRQAQAALPAQRVILKERVVTKVQRTAIQRDQFMKEQAAVEKAEEMRFEAEMLKQRQEMIDE